MMNYNELRGYFIKSKRLEQKFGTEVIGVNLH